MTMGSALFLLWISLSAAAACAQEGPNRPEPKPVALDTKSTAVLVLDLNARCDDPKQVCSKLTGPVSNFLISRRGLPGTDRLQVCASSKRKADVNWRHRSDAKKARRLSIPTHSTSSTAPTFRRFSKKKARKH